MPDWSLRKIRLFILDYWGHFLIGGLTVGLLTLSLIFLKGEREYRVDRLNNMILVHDPPPEPLSTTEEPTSPDYRWKRSILPLPHLESLIVDTPVIRVQNPPEVSVQQPRRFELSPQPAGDRAGPDS